MQQGLGARGRDPLPPVRKGGLRARTESRRREEGEEVEGARSLSKVEKPGFGPGILKEEE